MIPVKDYIDRIEISLKKIQNLSPDKRKEVIQAESFFEDLKEKLSKNQNQYVYENGWKGDSIEQIIIWESVINAINQ